MKPKPLIAGAGWAGLAAALTLAEQGVPCTLLEAAPQAGGRARDITWNNQRIDNGQHLFLGAYQQLYTLLAKLGICFDDYFLRQPLQLIIKHSANHNIVFTPAKLPMPFNMLFAWLCARGFSYREKLSALILCYRLKKQKFTLIHDISVKHWLENNQQSTALIHQFWAPLCVAALSTDLANASAQVFIRVLHDSFYQTATHADLIFAKKSLGAILPEPALAYLTERGCDIHLNTRVQTLHIEQQKIVGCSTNQGDWQTDNIIVATSPFAAVKLLQPHSALKSLTDNLNQLLPETIVTVYLQYAPTVTLPQVMTGLTGGLCQWVFDRGFMGQAGLLAAVISSQAAIGDLSNEAIGQTVATELAAYFPQLDTAHAIKVIREKQAAFQCRPHSNPLRPSNMTPLKGLWLAGDFTQTDYPACLEGAVKSGIQCGQQLATHYN
jgi:hydroxysqualene dehydroxylase